jgi:hypothetical protein
MANETGLRTLDPIAANPRVARLYKDDLGLWIELAPGWRSGRDVGEVKDTDGGKQITHTIIEDGVRDLWFKYRGIVSCDCDACISGRVDHPVAGPVETITTREVPNEVRAQRATRTSRDRGEVDAIGHQGGSVHKWKCSACQTWVKEPIGRACSKCMKNVVRQPEEVNV